MRKCEKILFNTIDKKAKHEVCKAFVGKDLKNKEKLNGNK